MPQTNSDSVPLASSFRDPAGYVFRRNGQIFRKINPDFVPQFRAFSDGPLYAELLQHGLIVPHTVMHEDSSGIEILPRQIPYVSYPYEWSFSQIKDAALLTLQLQKLSLAHDMTLKDASIYNVQFIGSKAVFIDTLSFAPLAPGQPWMAYRQFCEHFLGPLALMSQVDAGLNKLIVSHLEGIPLETIAHLLPFKSRFKYSLFVHLHLHARSQQKHANDAAAAQTQLRQPRMNKNMLSALVESLISAVKGCRLPAEKTEWGDYYSGTNYSESAMSEKEQVVQTWVSQHAVEDEIVHDMGANTGRFSALAAALGHYVIAHDVDRLAVERHYLARQQSHEPQQVLPLQLDLANPSPAIGWANQERLSFLDRCQGGFVLALALVHHLAIGNNTPLSKISDFFARFSRKLIIEFVPKEDSQVSRMLATREDIFTDYTVEGFEAAFTVNFNIVAKQPLAGTARALYLLEHC